MIGPTIFILVVVVLLAWLALFNPDQWRKR